MLGIVIANLLIPNNPSSLILKPTNIEWTLTRCPNFSTAQQAMQSGQCADTYFLDTPISLDTHGRGVADTALDEMTPILLGAAYATGLAVTSHRSTMSSEVKIMQPSEHWPRARALDQASPITSSEMEFVEVVEKFVRSWSTQGQTEKALLLIHHWLDGLACWSLEDLYLSATTLLQIIVATEEGRRGGKRLTFFDGVNLAADNYGLRKLSTDFKDMRNELIHDGRLIGTRFAGPDKHSCCLLAADVLNWIDEYIHAALALGTPRKTRFSHSDFVNLNAYSVV
jgi:hypothetical protein